MKKLKSLPSKEELLELLEYSPETGEFTWRARPLSMFPSAPKGKTWNAQFAGKKAFTVRNGNGYLCGYINYVKLYAHRVAWKITNGNEPDQIDHVNGIRDDNRISNLRAATFFSNAKNTSRRVDNTSGVTGVTWVKPARKWKAFINSDRKHTIIGMFDVFEDAVKARKAAELEFGFHANHGR